MGGRRGGVVQTWADCESSLCFDLGVCAFRSSPQSVWVFLSCLSFLSICFSVSFSLHLFSACLPFALVCLLYISASSDLPFLSLLPVALFPSVFLFYLPFSPSCLSLDFSASPPLFVSFCFVFVSHNLIVRFKKENQGHTVSLVLNWLKPGSVKLQSNSSSSTCCTCRQGK